MKKNPGDTGQSRGSIKNFAEGIVRFPVCEVLYKARSLFFGFYDFSCFYCFTIVVFIALPFTFRETKYIPVVIPLSFALRPSV